MYVIRPATSADSQLLAELGKQTFIESHGHSASPSDIEAYVSENYTEKFFRDQLAHPVNIYHLLFYDQRPVGYSKIMLDYSHSNIRDQNVTKLERIYLLQEVFDLKLGQVLFDFNLNLSKKSGQSGMWLFVWKENERAVRFYLRNGFEVVGSHDFKISETHSNPNHQLYLKY